MTVVETNPQATVQQRPAELTADLRFAIDAIVRAAKDPSVDVEKMERLVNLQLRLVAIAAESSFNQALARLQPQLPRIAKRGLIGRGTDREIAYARYEDICEVTLPLLFNEGFTVSYSERLAPNGNMMEIIATFRHIDGHKDTGSAFTPLVDDSGGKNKVQGGGSVYSYGQRYAFCKYLNIVMEGEDDDGMQKAMEPISEKQVSAITDLIDDITGNGQKFNDAGFLKLMGVKRIEDIIVRDYQKAISALNDKRRSGK